MNNHIGQSAQKCLVFLTAVAVGCSNDQNQTVFTDTDKSEFKVGQVWSYKTRPGEEPSTLVVLKVETAPGWKPIVHVGLTGLKIKTAKGFQDTIPHMPFDETALKNSVT